MNVGDSIRAGNKMELSFAFRPDPDEADVSIDDIVCAITSPAAYAADITPDVTTPATNRFKVKVLVPYDAPEDDWTVTMTTTSGEPTADPYTFHVVAN